MMDFYTIYRREMKKSQLCHTRNQIEESIYHELCEFLQLSVFTPVLISQQRSDVQTNYSLIVCSTVITCEELLPKPSAPLLFWIEVCLPLTIHVSQKAWDQCIREPPWVGRAAGGQGSLNLLLMQGTKLLLTKPRQTLAGDASQLGTYPQMNKRPLCAQMLSLEHSIKTHLV